MSRYNRIAALLQTVSTEDNDNSAAVVINVDVKNEPPVEDEIEIVEASDEVTEDSEVVDDLDEAAATLESICEELHEAVQHGGLDQMGARRAHRELRGIQRRLGVESALPALESFGGSSDRLRATSVSLEEANSTLSKVWQAIKNAIIKVWDGIKNLFAKLFGGFEKVKARAEAVKKSADEAKGNVKGKVKLATAGRLTVGGKFDPEQALANVEKAYVATYTQITPALAEVINQAVESNKQDDFTEGAKDILAASVQDGSELAGGYGFKKLNLLEGSFKLRGYGLKKVVEGQIAQDQEVDAANQAEIKAITDKIVSIADAALKYKKDQESYSALINKSIKALDSKLKENNNGLSARKAGLSVVRSASNALARNTNEVAKLGFVTSRSALSYAEKSLATIGAKEEKAA